MSRNFDLLAEIERERESGTESDRARRPADRSAVKEFPPKDADADGQEMLGLVQSIFLSNAESAPRQVVFFGVDSESGSSSVCAKAGRALAASTSKPVCMVDANVRSARLSHIFGVDKTIPFSGKFASVREPCVQVGGNLWLAGTDLMCDARGSLLPIDELKHRLTQLDGAFEYLLIDAPGTRESKDAELLGHLADAGVLVIEADKTRRIRAGKAKASLDAAGVRLLGTVLNNRSFPIPAKLYNLL